MNPLLFDRYYRRYSGARLRVLVLVCLSAFLLPVSVSSSLVAVPRISADLSASAVIASWIPAAYLLSSLVVQLPSGRLSDLYGRKRLFLIGYSLFALGGLLGALAPNMELLLASRLVQGAGGAIGTGAGMAMLTGVFHREGRGAALGWMTATVYLGMTSGPLIGGWLVEHFDWPAVFLFPVPLTLLVLALTLRSIRGEWTSQEQHRVDWRGSLYFALGMIALFIGATNLVQIWGLPLSLLAVLLIHQFVRRSNRISYPLVKFDLLAKNATFMRSVFAAVFMYSSQYGIMFMMTLYLQYNRGLSPSDTGQLMMLQAVMMTLCAPLAGRISDRWDGPKLATLGCILIALGNAVLGLMSDTTSLLVIGLAIMTIGTGHGLFSTPINSAAIGTIPQSRLGIAAAILSLARVNGQLLGTAILSLLMAIYFDGKAITPDQYPEFAEVAKIALWISFAMACGAAWYASREAKS